MNPSAHTAAHPSHTIKPVGSGWTCNDCFAFSPGPPVTVNMLLSIAANDPAVSDDTFVVLRRALEGEL